MLHAAQHRDKKIEVFFNHAPLSYLPKLKVDWISPSLGNA